LPTSGREKTLTEKAQVGRYQKRNAKKGNRNLRPKRKTGAKKREGIRPGKGKGRIGSGRD